ncbi:efflux RND transporter periplasmic adaptor subunit [Parashewanella spongiae]|uniref:Efflux RND transporter periplasmic adaptor subunit n=1 Tax=Parashewanella spongiae TaxID=342950 RepID=A0A3A6TX53_9GAMM|nr:efflux RND transporter periplasmic adaptor subunit [Parashewanella spongiae]MCL1078206.1 efflux RND transporter periplasmic adaptor subunit [Parashewanella spongiae]RJY16401.1 efflux RND transporter periplasmic adaptor subunit [Parashewanella spongiae]
MATIKQIILPIVVIGGAVMIAVGLASMKKPPEEKPKTDNRPVVSIQVNQPINHVHTIKSYGVVTGKYETELVAQVSGEIQFIADAFVRGGFVRKGEILAKVDPIDYEANLIDAEAQLASAQASLVTEKAQGKVAEREWAEITKGTPTELSLRKPQLAQELARLKSAQANLKRAKRNFERTIIRAPYDALVEARNVGLGSYVNTGSMLGKIISVDTAEVRLPVADKELAFLNRSGEQATVTIETNLAGKVQSWNGKIIRSEGVVDKNSRMTYLVAQVMDPYGLNSEQPKLKFGSYITARISGEQARQVSIIPRHLIVEDKVAVLGDDKLLKLKPVTILRESGTDAIISSGLEAGDRIIISALDYPLEGMELALPEDIKKSKSKPTAEKQEAESTQ